MRFGWILLVVLLLAQVDGQKRRKGDKKKDTQAAVEVTTTTAKPVEKRTRSTTTTTTTMIPTTLVEEDIEEEIIIVDVPISASNQCPPDLKEGSTNSSCICKDQLEDNAIMIECVALSSAQEMHKIFNTWLLGKRIDALEVRNSTLGPLVDLVTAQAYVGTILMRGNEITELNPSSFKGTENYVNKLDLGSNQLTKIDFTLFNTFSQLQVLNLGENLLTTIEDAGEAPSLRVLYLYSNKIDAIAPKAFQKLTGLEYLDLRWNNLQTLSPSALDSTSERWQLRLRANQISSLDQVFSQDHLPYLIDLSLNNIAQLTDVVYGPLIELALLEGSKIYLAGNPIQCDCTLAWLIKSSRMLSTVVGARCDGDKNGITLAELNLEEFRKCPPPKAWYSPLDKAMAGGDPF